MWLSLRCSFWFAIFLFQCWIDKYIELSIISMNKHDYNILVMSPNAWFFWLWLVKTNLKIEILITWTYRIHCIAIFKTNFYLCLSLLSYFSSSGLLWVSVLIFKSWAIVCWGSQRKMTQTKIIEPIRFLP